MVFVSLGAPVSLAARREIPPDTELVVGKDYELEHHIREVRPLTPKEVEGTLAYFTRQWAIEHPEYELKHVAFERSSQPIVRVQFTVRKASPIAISTVIAIAVSLLIAAVVATVIFYAWEVIRTIAYEIVKFVQNPLDYAKDNPLGAVLIGGGLLLVGFMVYNIIRSAVHEKPKR